MYFSEVQGKWYGQAMEPGLFFAWTYSLKQTFLSRYQGSYSRS